MESEEKTDWAKLLEEHRRKLEERFAEEFSHRYSDLRMDIMFNEIGKLDQWKEADTDEFKTYTFADLIALEGRLLLLIRGSRYRALDFLHYLSNYPDNQNIKLWIEREIMRNLRMNERSFTLRRVIDFAAEHGMAVLRGTANEDIPETPREEGEMWAMLTPVQQRDLWIYERFNELKASDDYKYDTAVETIREELSKRATACDWGMITGSRIKAVITQMRRRSETWSRKNET